MIPSKESPYPSLSYSTPLPETVDEIRAELEIISPFRLPDEGAHTKVLLVVNNRTKYVEINRWKWLLSSCVGNNSLSISIWNTSLYNGFSFQHQADGERDLAQLFSGPNDMVVILNNCSSAGISRSQRGEWLPLSRLPYDELRYACRERGCNVYIPGYNFCHPWKHCLHYPLDLGPNFQASSNLRTFDSETELIEQAPSTLWSGDKRLYMAKASEECQSTVEIGNTLTNDSTNDLVCTTKINRRFRRGKSEVMAAATKIANKLAAIHPEVQFSVIYKTIEKPDQEPVKTTGRKMPPVYTIGEVFVLKGIHYSEGRLVLSNLADDTKTTAENFVHHETTSVRNMYGVLKTFPFQSKVRILKEAGNDGKISFIEHGAYFGSYGKCDYLDLSVVVTSILSDLADELAVFSHGTDSTKTKLKKLFRPGKKKDVDSHVNMWMARMKYMNCLCESSDVFGTIVAGSTKFDEVFRLCVGLKQLIKSIEKRSTCDMVIRAAHRAYDAIASNLCRAVGDGSNGPGLETPHGESIFKSIEEAAVADRGSAKLKFFREAFSFATPLASTEEGSHRTMVMSMEEYRWLCSGTPKNCDKPDIQWTPLCTQNAARYYPTDRCFRVLENEPCGRFRPGNVRHINMHSIRPTWGTW